jgi:hypothetical protein
MTIPCNTCDSHIVEVWPAVDGNVVECPSCGSVFELPEGEGSSGPKVRVPVPLPEGMRVDRLRSSLRIVRRWLTKDVYPLLFGAVCWNLFLVGWYWVMFTTEGAPLLMKIVPIPFVLIGVLILHATFSWLFNRTVIEFAGGDLIIRHGPIRVAGNRRIRCSELKQLYCKNVITGDRRASGNTQYQLDAVLTNGDKITLVSGLLAPEQAWFLEQEIERYLKISDEHVSGEMWANLETSSDDATS